MPTAKLTDRAVGKLKPRAGRRRDVVWDHAQGAPAGFGVRISGETRTYVQTYRLDGRFVWYTIGDVEKVSLSRARDRAKEVLAEVTLGQDPAKQKVEKRRAVEERRNAADFEALITQYVDAREPDLAPSTLAEYRRKVAAYVHGPLGRKIATEVTAEDIAKRLSDVADGAPVQANRLFQLIKAACRWGRRKGRLALNPMEAVDRPRKEKPRERVLRDDEVALLLRSLDRKPEPGEAKIPATVAGAVKTLLLLGQRSTETVLMRWEDLDVEADVPTWTIPGSFRKGGLLHVVPLPAFALRVIEELRPSTKASGRVFSGVSEKNEERDWWGLVRDRMTRDAKRAGIDMKHFTKHDLRRTAMTGMTRAGSTRFVAQRVLGHKEVGVGSVYDRNDYLREKAAALAAWSRQIERVASGEKRRAKVVSITR